MEKRIVYNLFLLTLILYFGVPALVDMDKAGAARSPVREDAFVKRVPLAMQDLGLKLLGTVVAEDPEDSLAVIEDRSTGKQLPRREGDKVGKALIKKILRNEVIIDAGKGDEMLTMLHGQPSVRQLTLYQAAGTQPPANTVTPTRLDRKQVEPYFADMNLLKQRLRLHPITEEDEPAGFLIRNVRRGGILWRIGLRNRDVIKGVNGEAITSPAEADVLFQTLKQGGKISIEIERRKLPQELHLAIQ